jgi:uncharacterized protein (TIRG00374 family)
MNRQQAIRILKSVVAALLGVAILVVLYSRIGWRELLGELGQADPVLFVVALAFFIPQVVLMTWRWQLIGRTARPLSFGQACQMVLAGSALNVILPSKLGDFAKGIMLGEKTEHGIAGGIGLAALDKFMDLLGLATVLVLAGFLAPESATWVRLFWVATLAGLVGLAALLHLAPRIRRMPRRKALGALARGVNAAVEVRHKRAIWAGALALSVLLWVLHIGQIYVFYRAVAGARPEPAASVFMHVSIAIFIGLLPVTMAGIGTRDFALVELKLIEPATVAGLVGAFCTLRYVVMAVLGVPAIWLLGPKLTKALRKAENRPLTQSGRADDATVRRQ